MRTIWNGFQDIRPFIHPLTTVSHTICILLLLQCDLSWLVQKQNAGELIIYTHAHTNILCRGCWCVLSYWNCFHLFWSSSPRCLRPVSVTLLIHLFVVVFFCVPVCDNLFRSTTFCALWPGSVLRSSFLVVDVLCCLPWISFRAHFFSHRSSVVHLHLRTFILVDIILCCVVYSCVWVKPFCHRRPDSEQVY